MEVMDDAQHFGLIPVLTTSATMLLYQLPLLLPMAIQLLLFTFVSDHEVIVL